MYKKKKSKIVNLIIIAIIMVISCLLISYYVTYEKLIDNTISESILEVQEQSCFVNTFDEERSIHIESIQKNESIEINLCADSFNNSFCEIQNNERAINTLSIDDVYDKLTSEEKKLAIQDPIRAYKAYLASIEASTKAEQFYVSNQLYLGNGDAFRHAYWNALMVKRCGTEFAQQMATAHESDTPEGLDKQMDLKNNAYGRWDGEKYINLTDEELAIKIRDLVTDGQYIRIVNSRFRPTNGDGLI